MRAGRMGRLFACSVRRQRVGVASLAALAILFALGQPALGAEVPTGARDALAPTVYASD